MKKKVLIVGSQFWGYNESVARAFEHHGFVTKVIGFRDIYGVPNKIRYALNPFKSASLQNRNYINRLILKTHEEFRPDIFFVIKGTILEETTLKRIEGSSKVLWMMDSIYKYKQIYDLKSYFDHLFFFEKTDVDKLKEENIVGHFLPLALDEKVYHPISGLNRDIDLFFVGSLSDDRLELLYKLVDSFRDYNIKFYGKRIWTSNKPFNFFFNRNIFPNRTLSPNEVNLYYNQSKICLNLHKSQSHYGVNQRFFEILGAGAYQIVNFNPYIGENFKDIDLTTFNDFKELKEIISNRISKRWSYDSHKISEFIKLNHSFKYRISEVLRVVDIE
jgi:spore maturation protein CgeB